MSHGEYVRLREQRVVSDTGELAAAWVSCYMYDEVWDNARPMADDVLGVGEMCVVTKLKVVTESGATRTFARVVYARGIRWVNHEHVTALGKTKHSNTGPYVCLWAGILT